MTDPQRPTVTRVSAPYANFLRPVPPVVDGVCAGCRCGIRTQYRRCYNCQQHPAATGRTLDAVAFVALAPAEEQLALELRRYKDSLVESTRTRFQRGLAAVLWRWLYAHEPCLAAAVGITGFDAITTVPSSSSGRTGNHPLVNVVRGWVVGSGDRYRDLLRPTGVSLGPRELSAVRFEATADLRGTRVLVVDDTWTTGAKMYGAAAALKAGGASAVGGLAIGRWYHPKDQYNLRWRRPESPLSGTGPPA